MKFKILILLFTFSIIQIFATSQEPDRIIINNKEYALLNNPLDKYFENHPDDHPIYGHKIRMFNKYKKKILPIPFRTSNYRGYIALFKIENNQLSLVDLKVQKINSKKRKYISVYQKLFGNKKIVLNYSGILIIPTGKFIEAANFGYSSLYDQYQLMTVKNDTVVKEKQLNKDEFIGFKVNRFDEYKKTEDYKTELKNYLNSWEEMKKSELSQENTKGMSQEEITELEKEYEHAPNEEYIDNFLFLTRNTDFVIIDY